MGRAGLALYIKGIYLCPNPGQPVVSLKMIAQTDPKQHFKTQARLDSLLFLFLFFKNFRDRKSVV